MTFAVSYRLTTDERGSDRLMLREVYEQLATVRPSWLTAETFAAEDGQSMIFLIHTEAEVRLPELAALSRYRDGLDQRCVFPPQTYPVRRATIDELPLIKIAFWNPYRKTWAFPPHVSLGLTQRPFPPATRPA